MEILPQLIINSLITGSIYALASAGLALTYGLLRILNFAHGHIMMVGAYVFYYLFISNDFNLFSSAILTFIFSLGLSFIALRVFITPFLPFSYLLPLITTLSLATILESIISIIFGVNVKSLSASSELTSYEWGTIFITPMQIVIILSALLLLLTAAFIIHLSSVGRKIRALAENPHASEAIGINRRAINYGVFAASTALSMFAGIMVGFETNLQPTMGNAYTVKAFAAMILGGLANIWGTIAGSYILGLIENLSIGLDFGEYSIPAGYKDAFAFMIILIVLLVCPKGLFNRSSRST